MYATVALIVAIVLAFGYTQHWFKAGTDKAKEVLSAVLPASATATANPQDALTQARQAFASGNVQGAVNGYREVLAKNPEDIDAMGELGNVLYSDRLDRASRPDLLRCRQQGDRPEQAGSGGGAAAGDQPGQPGAGQPVAGPDVRTAVAANGRADADAVRAATRKRRRRLPLRRSTADPEDRRPAPIRRPHSGRTLVRPECVYERRPNASACCPSIRPPSSLQCSGTTVCDL
ncbi:MAG: hypothetical protein MZW92_77155 [Comamonadaceae bacterium]|nr:hypothetical protein [Comamonadaceae bacterium]